MAKVKQTSSTPTRKRSRPALNPEAREQQMIALAVNLAEQQLLDGTASSQVITHYLKLGATRERLEKEKLIEEIKLQRAKTEAIKSSKRSEELMEEAIKAFREYSGDIPDDEDY